MNRGWRLRRRIVSAWRSRAAVSAARPLTWGCSRRWPISGFSKRSIILSTVSGGGYVGGFWTAWLTRKGEKPGAARFPLGQRQPRRRARGGAPPAGVQPVSFAARRALGNGILGHRDDGPGRTDSVAHRRSWRCCFSTGSFGWRSLECCSGISRREPSRWAAHWSATCWSPSPFGRPRARVKKTDPPSSATCSGSLSGAALVVAGSLLARRDRGGSAFYFHRTFGTLFRARPPARGRHGRPSFRAGGAGAFLPQWEMGLRFGRLRAHPHSLPRRDDFFCGVRCCFGGSRANYSGAFVCRRRPLARSGLRRLFAWAKKWLMAPVEETHGSNVLRTAMKYLKRATPKLLASLTWLLLFLLVGAAVHAFEREPRCDSQPAVLACRSRGAHNYFADRVAL